MCKNLGALNKIMKVTCFANTLVSLIIFWSIRNAHGQGGGGGNNKETTPTTTMAPTEASNNGSYNESSAYPIPPWGASSFGAVDWQTGQSLYGGAPGFADVVRGGWSWTRREMRASAPFCYDSLPGYGSGCYTENVRTVCERSLGGTAGYGDSFCLSKRPFDLVGPVCWNGTCYANETLEACNRIGGSFVGDVGSGALFQTSSGVTIEGQNAAWCAIPGKQHTIVGPACYGEECFTKDLAAACKTLNGTNFADRFCLVDESYKVIGPICTPVAGPVANASVCHPNETRDLCTEMKGINIGDIFCVVKGDYSVLGPFCSALQYESEPGQIYADCASATDAKTACAKISGRSVGEGMFCILPDSDYHLLGPLCHRDGGCWLYDDSPNGGENKCLKDFGGTSVGAQSCIIKGEYTIVGPATFGDVRFGGDNILADDLDESAVFSPILGDPSWYVLNGTYSVFGPTCYGFFCYDGDCIKAGGSRINSIFCIMAVESVSMGFGYSSLSTAISFYILFSAVLPLL